MILRMHIQIILFDGFDELDVFAPFEVLHMATRFKPDLQVQLVSLDKVEHVVSGRGIQVRAQGCLGEPKPDLIIVPGGGWMDRSPQGARAEHERGVLPARIRELHVDGAIAASVCTGAMLLASAGLLKGRPAITHHGAVGDLSEAGAQVVEARVVDAGDVITAGGVTSGLDLALWIVERFVGAQAANQIENGLEYERRGTVWRAS